MASFENQGLGIYRERIIKKGGRMFQMAFQTKARSPHLP
jgi:hypothetical protein